jgi:tripartite-type tricarboxylate transporter receptor subunit TctC
VKGRIVVIRLRYIVPLLVLPLMPVAPVQSAEFPSRPVTSLGPFGAGGGADTMLRAVAGVIKPHLGQPLVHVNKAGGGSTIAANVVAKGKPDGYTIVTLVSTGAIPEIYTHFREAPYTSKDLRPVIRMTANPYALWVHADSPVKTVEDFVKAAKAKAGQMTFAHAGRGHIYHLLMTALQNKAGIKLRDVPTKGGGPTIKETLGKHVDAGIASAQSGKKYMEAGTLRMLAVEHSGRIPWAPDVKTFAEQGYDFNLSPWYLSVFVNAKTPDPIVNTLHDALKASLEDPKFLDIAKKSGMFIDYGTAAAVLNDVENDRKVILPLLKQLGMGPK